MTVKVCRSRDISLHKAGVDFVRKKYSFLVPTDKYGCDHYSTRTGIYARQRTVAYGLGDTWIPSNKMVNKLFIETINVDVNGERGGPWQAKDMGNDVFMYLFMLNKQLIIISLTPKTLAALEALTHNYTDCIQNNHGYVSIGKLMPINDLKSVLHRSLAVIDLS